MTNRVFVLERLEHHVWRPLVSGVRKKRVKEHLAELVDEGARQG